MDLRSVSDLLLSRSTVPSRLHRPRPWPALALMLTTTLAAGASMSLAADGPASLTALRQAVKSRDQDSARQALLEISEAGFDAGLLSKLLAVAPKTAPLGIYAELVEAFSSPSDQAAFEALLKSFTRARKLPMVYLLADALGHVGNPAAVEALAKGLSDRDTVVASIAARSLARIPARETVAALIEALEECEKRKGRRRILLEVLGALRTVTGEDIQDAIDWKGWWQSRANSYTPPEQGSDKDGASPESDETVVDRLRKERPSEVRTVERLQKDDIVVVGGSSDQVEKVLRAIDMPYTYVRRDDFDKVELDPKQLLVLNCAGNRRLSESGLAKIAKFVHQGGYLFSSDWELRNTLVPIFGDLIDFVGETPREEFEVHILPSPQDAEHPLLRDVFPLNPWEQGSFAWKMEQRCHLLKPGRGAVVLIVSPELGERTSNSHVAVTFQVSGGRVATGARPTRKVGAVLHVLSHFKLQEDPKGDGFALQQLLLNFILEKLEGRRTEG